MIGLKQCILNSNLLSHQNMEMREQSAKYLCSLIADKGLSLMNSYSNFSIRCYYDNTETFDQILTCLCDMSTKLRIPSDSMRTRFHCETFKNHCIYETSITCVKMFYDILVNFQAKQPKLILKLIDHGCIFLFL